eukprot:TRINITY_DN14636_c0_g2_i1.p1 TRINITY_DN14636_c0_g2~~TRINITY_DN14636_c0_g2_i1.p1  ORF type:complete len:490 (+),score=55.33 TRINITY_DN14636_c0_g2_i1:38-1471(+)
MPIFDPVVPLPECTAELSYHVAWFEVRRNFVASVIKVPDEIMLAQLGKVLRFGMVLACYGVVFSCVFTLVFAGLISFFIPRSTSLLGACFLRDDWRSSLTCQEWVELTTCTTGESETPLGSFHDYYILSIARPFGVLSIAVNLIIFLQSLFAKLDGVCQFVHIFPAVITGIYVCVWVNDPLSTYGRYAGGIITMMAPILVACVNHLQGPEKQIVRCLKGKVMGLAGLTLSTFGVALYVFLMLHLGRSSMNGVLVTFAADLLLGALSATAVWILFEQSLERVPFEAKVFLVFGFDVMCEQALKDYIIGLGNRDNALLANFGKTIGFLLRRLVLPVILLDTYRDKQKREMLLTSVVTSMSAEIVTLVISVLRPTCFEPAYFDIVAPTQPVAVEALFVAFAFQFACVLSSNLVVLYQSVLIWRYVGGGSDDAASSESFCTNRRVIAYLLAKCLTCVSMIGFMLRTNCMQCDEGLLQCFVC